MAAWLTGCSNDSRNDSPNDSPIATTTVSVEVPSIAKNLLLISIDTLRPDMLGCYGYDRPTSPTIDRLASGGVLFENAMTTAPWTLPAHASLFTGLYPRHHGIDTEGTALPSDVETIAQVLRERGFTTAAVLSNKRIGPRNGLDRGFDVFEPVSRAVVKKSPFATVDRAVAWLKEPRDAPFFLFVHDFHVHTNYESLPEYEAQFVRPYDGEIRGKVKELKKFRKGELPIDTADRNHLIDLYVSGIRQSDDGVGRLLDSLDASGLARETLVVLVSDHGEEFLEHGGVLHGKTQYQELTRIPLIMRGPGVPKNTRIAPPVSLVDVFPTALALLRQEKSQEVDGVDLSSVWDAAEHAVPEPHPDRTLYSEADHHNEEPGVLLAARRGRYKLHFDRLTKEVRLYDLAEDPGETTDISESEPETTKALLGQLERFASGTVEGKVIVDLDAETRENLKALGYIDDDN